MTRRVPKSALGLFLLVQCSPAAAVRPQVVVVIETTAPVVGELRERPELSGDLTVDTLRVDALDRAGVAYRIEQFIAPELLDWPISFGVKGGELPTTRLRLRAFRATRSDPERLLGQNFEKPWRETAIDRLVELPLPTEGVETMHVVLDAACLGTPVSLFEPATTCVDGGELSGPPSDGVLGDPAGPAQEASFAAESPCAAQARAGRVCIPGGFSVLGDPSLSGIGSFTQQDVVPLRPVRLRPFFMDVAEFTVGRFRSLLNAGSFHGELPAPTAANDAYCTFQGADVATKDDFALTCVTRAAAEELCALEGGALPTEAQWEHAARGRGQQRAYPWGADAPDCCVASLDRRSPVFVGNCPGSGPEPSASHLPSASCAGRGDVSRDGVRDLGGGVGELVQDSFVSYADACWSGAGIPLDPLCDESKTTLKSARGGNWSSGLQTSLAALRPLEVQGDTAGFRCVYEDEP